MTDTIEHIFEKAGAILKGHFLLTSGLHSPVYWEKIRVLQFPEYTEKLCSMIADHFRGQDIQLAAGPTMGGVIIAFEIARQLGIQAIYAEKESNGERAFRRGSGIQSGARVLVVDDILTTGGSIREVMAAVDRQDGVVAGIGVLVDRSEQSIDFGVPLFSCYHTVIQTYTSENCPLCAAKIPLVKPGGR